MFDAKNARRIIAHAAAQARNGHMIPTHFIGFAQGITYYEFEEEVWGQSVRIFKQLLRRERRNHVV